MTPIEPSPHGRSGCAGRPLTAAEAEQVLSSPAATLSDRVRLTIEEVSRTSPSLGEQVLTACVELQRSVLDLLEVDPRPEHLRAAQGLQDAITELVVAAHRAEPPGVSTAAPRNAVEPDSDSTTTPPPAGKRTTLGDIAREQLDLLQRCLIQAAPALTHFEELLHTLSKAEASVRDHGGTVLVVTASHSLLRTVRDAMGHPGWKAAGVSFPCAISLRPRCTSEPTAAAEGGADRR